MKILIADDDAISRRLLETTLLRAGYDVVAAENGMVAAEQLCKQDGPRLALLDWEMPELDGPAVCREGIFTLIVSLARLLAARFRRPYVFLSIETSSAASPR